MKEISHSIKEARAFLINSALNEICNETVFSKFQSRASTVLAERGLIMKANQENLLSGDEWNDPSNRTLLIKKLQLFLIKHIV